MGQASVFGLIRPISYSPAVIAEGVTRMMQLQYNAAPSLTLLPLPIVWALWDAIPHSWLFAWWIFATLNPIAQYLVTRHYLNGEHEPARAVFFARCLTFVALFVGLPWGMAGMVLPWISSVQQQILILGMVIGIPAASIFPSSYWPPALYVATIPCVGLTAITLGMQGTPASKGIAALLLFYIPFIMLMTELTRRASMGGIQLQFENLDLVGRLREEKEKAEAASRDKTRFLASASHDLRQPVHALTLFADALHPSVQDDRGKLLLTNIDHSINALNQLLESLLDISKLDANIIKPNLEHFALGPLLDTLHTEYAAQAQAKGLVWKLNMENEIVVHSDPVLLGTMLRNLISNAIRYTRTGSVEIFCTRQNQVVHINVKDTGIGIPQEQHREIFREFYQLTNQERDRSKGLGLGLAIVDRLALLLQHRIEVDSEFGKGSCFTIVLSAGNAASVLPPVASQPFMGQRDVYGMRIVVIDDEQAVRDGMQAVLESWGCEVTLAGSEEETMEKLKGCAPPHIIIADYRLRDGKSGDQAIERLRVEFGKDIPALIITGDTGPDRLREAQASGHTLMHKPVQPAKLRAYLRRVQRRKA